MRYLGLALFAEGATDHAFLRPVLRRLCADLCLEFAEQPVEIGEVLMGVLKTLHYLPGGGGGRGC